MGKTEPSLTAPEPLWRRRHDRKGYWYVLPAIVLLGVMVFYPIARSLYLSFFDFSFLDPDAARFVGAGNYVRMFEEEANRKPFWNTLYFTVIFTPPYVIFALVIAMLLNRVRRGTVFLRTIIFTPVVVSFAVSAVMWTLFYDPKFGMAHRMIEGTCSAINWLVGPFGAGPVAAAPASGVLGDARWSMPAIAAVCVWNGVGVNVILFLVGLQRIPEELYEAAEVDGAGRWQRFLHVTFPQLRPTTYLVVLLSMIGAFKIFGQPYIMTQGGPKESTLTFVMRLYNLAFSYGKFQLGYAAALAYSLAVFIFIMTLLVRRFNRPVEQ